MWSDELVYFAERLLDNKLSYSKSVRLAPGICFAGPKKAFKLLPEELRVLHSAEGISSNFGWCFKHAIINGFRFDVPPEKLAEALSCNCIFSTKSGGLFFLNTFLLIEQKGFALCKKIQTKQHMGPDLDDFIIKVGGVGTRTMIVRIENIIGLKYHLLLQEGGKIAFLTKLPNTREIE